MHATVDYHDPRIYIKSTKKTIQITQKISQIIYVGKENLKISKEDQIKHTENKIGKQMIR